MQRLALGLMAVSLSACVSTGMKPMVGQSTDELLMRYGRPEQVIELSDGGRAYQFRQGGGSVFVPGMSATRATPIGNTLVATTTATPSAVLETQGCLLTFIARQEAGRWMVREIRVPKQLVC